MISGIYKIINIINNKFYIGSSNNIKIRFNSHIRELKRNNHDNKYLQRAYNKHGLNNFKLEIIEECNKEKLFEREQYYLDALIFQNKNYKETGYNMSKTAKGGFCGKILKGEKHPRHIKISVFDLNMNFIEEIGGVKETSRKYTIPSANILCCCKDKQSKAGNYIFRYSNKIESTYKKKNPGRKSGFKSDSEVIMYKQINNKIQIIKNFNSLSEAKRETGIDPRTIKIKCKNNESYKNEFYFKFKNREL